MISNVEWDFRKVSRDDWEERYARVMEKRARQREYEVLRECTVEEVLPFTGPDAENRLYNGHMVKMSSLRYQTFSKSLSCKCCGLIGSLFLLELPSNGGKVCRPHFNLYGTSEGKLVQMTKDHIIAKSKGGGNHINNMQTLCSRCNELKGNTATKLKRLREIQDGVRTVYTVLSVGGFPMGDTFATSHEGLVEIVTKYIDKNYGWEDIEVQTSIRLLKVYVKAGHGTTEFPIKPIRRVG